MPPRRKTYDVTWNGTQIRNHVFQSTKNAINEVMGDCVAEAQPNTPYVTGNLRRSIKIQELAKQERETVAGLWGSADVDYALAVESGTDGGPVQVSAHTRQIKRTGTTQSVRAHTRETNPRPGVNMLRNAADSNYKNLAPKIKANLRNKIATG